MALRSRADHLHILTALDAASEELEQLMRDEDWYVTDVTDLLASAREIVTSNLEELKHEQSD